MTELERLRMLSERMLQQLTDDPDPYLEAVEPTSRDADNVDENPPEEKNKVGEVR